jgi:hypothetical protein
LKSPHMLLLCSDALFLDLALEGTARRAVEAALPTLRAAAAAEAGGGSSADLLENYLRQLLRIAAVAAVAAAQSEPGDAELALAVRGLQVMLVAAAAPVDRCKAQCA